ncbi:Protein IST1 [Fasciola gigantica]|uniref:IST1 homolog n=1 Tax=Fasciola gigantica TaxID=46835 RepID=A0A504YHF0_FASGI|nr:Protein IST1 [Fasciola gigantica]
MSGDKLKTRLRLTSHRLRLQQKKKIESSLKAHKSVTESITAGRFDRARMQTEQIVRDDFTAEAMDLLEGYCDLLLARFNLYEAKKMPDENLLECVSTLIWSASSLGAAIPELKDVAKLLQEKYGDKFCESILTDATGVNQRVRLWLDELPPPQAVIERYMEEIAESHGVKYHRNLIPAPGPDDGSTMFLWQRDSARALAKAQAHGSCDVQMTSLPDLSGLIKVTEAKHSLATEDTNDEEQLVERLNRLSQP